MRAEQFVARAARQREIADRERVRPSRLSVPAPVAERVELLNITEIEPGLSLHPFAQADLQRAMRPRCERAEGQRVPGVRSRRARPRHEDIRLPLAHRDDGGIQPKLDLRVVVPGFLCDGRFASWLSHRGV